MIKTAVCTKCKLVKELPELIISKKMCICTTCYDNKHGKNEKYIESNEDFEEVFDRFWNEYFNIEK